MSTSHNVYKFANSYKESVPGNSETVSLAFYKDGKEVPISQLPGGVTARVAKVRITE